MPKGREMPPKQAAGLSHRAVVNFTGGAPHGQAGRARNGGSLLLPTPALPQPGPRPRLIISSLHDGLWAATLEATGSAGDPQVKASWGRKVGRVFRGPSVARPHPAPWKGPSSPFILAHKASRALDKWQSRCVH